MGAFENLLVELTGQTAIITLNRVEKLNALNTLTLQELSQVLSEMEVNPSIRGILITGAGHKGFVAGADIKEFVDKSVDQAMELSRFVHEDVMNKIQYFPKPVIAAINGFALGGGLELALSCHMRVIVQTAKIGFPEVSLGIIPGYGGTQRLTQLVGSARALEMILTADMIDAQQALQWGIVNHLVETQEELLPKGISILEKIYSRASTAITAAIDAIQTGVLNPEIGYQREIELFGNCFGSAEMQEGVVAFLEKRKPNF